MATTNNNNNTENEHLLENKWVLWYRPPSNNSAAQAKDWESSQQLKFTADTVENFWRGFHELPRIRPGHVLNCDYSLFKKGIKPMWEDEWNKCGGRWTYTVERRQANLNMSSSNIIAQAWLDVMLCLIGEGFDPYGHQIGGGVCGIRNGRGPAKGPDHMLAKIHVWTKDASDAEANMRIGEILKEVLHAPDGSLSYGAHETAGGRNKNYSYKL